eukprot:3268869-Rhodomonas_salina.2
MGYPWARVRRQAWGPSRWELTQPRRVWSLQRNYAEVFPYTTRQAPSCQAVTVPTERADPARGRRTASVQSRQSMKWVLHSMKLLSPLTRAPSFGPASISTCLLSLPLHGAQGPARRA